MQQLPTIHYLVKQIIIIVTPKHPNAMDFILSIWLRELFPHSTSASYWTEDASGQFIYRPRGYNTARIGSG